MNEAASSSFTDLLVNQPILVWSLAGGIAILVIAGFLSVFLAVRSRSQKRKAELDSLAATRKKADEMGVAKAAVTELKELQEEREDEEEGTAVYQAPIETVTLGIDGEENCEAANFVQTGAGDSGEAMAVAVEKSYDNASEADSDLAALFTADVVVDPHLQALRDNLPEVSIEDLLSNIRSVSTELQKHVNAVQVAEN